MTRFVFKVFMAFCVCSVALFAAKAPDDKCYFPPYNKEERYCNDYYSSVHNEAQCKAKKLESGYDEWVANLKGLLDNVGVKLWLDKGAESEVEDEAIGLMDFEGEGSDTKQGILVIDFSEPLIQALSIDFSDYYGNYLNIREATECNGKSCTTKGYDNKGMLIYEANCISGVNHGAQRLYDKSKGLVMELNYNQGKLDGKQKIPQSLNADNYTEYDDYMEYDDYTDAEFIINDVVVKNGKLNGKINIMDSDSMYKMKLNGEFKNGKPISKLNIYVHRQGGHSGGSDELTLPFDKNSIINGEGVYMSGRAIYGNGNTTTAKYNFKNNQIISFDFKIEYESDLSFGDIADIRERVYKECGDITEKKGDSFDGKGYAVRHGIGYFNNKGQKMGKWVQKHEYYYEGSVLEICRNKLKNYSKTLESNYENDKLNGAQKEWLNGKLIKETMYEKGVLNGTLKEWDNNGNLIKAEIYKNGNRVQIIR